MGFWHTGYMEFHEPLDFEGFYNPAPPKYNCQHCNETFKNPQDLQRHRFEKHPYNRPVLWVGGMEVGTTPLNIVRPISAEEIVTNHASFAWINGKSLQPMEIGNRLSEIDNDTVRIKLGNEGVEADFILKIEVASENHLKGIDQCFFVIAKGKNLNIGVVNNFIETSKCYPTAKRYLDGICHYLYGVLAKEKSLASNLPHASYIERFNLAADELKDFDTPLSRIIRALISFHFNQFKEAAELEPDSRIGLASNRFSAWLSSKSFNDIVLLKQLNKNNIEAMLTDAITECLLEWSLAEPSDPKQDLSQIERIIQTGIPDYDRAKMRILLSESYAKVQNYTAARRHARELQNSASFAPWADHFLKYLNKNIH